MTSHHIVVLPSKRIDDLAEISRRDPEKVFVVVPNWGSPNKSNTWVKGYAARSGHVMDLPLRLVRLIAVFGARPGYIIEIFDLTMLLWGDREDGGPDNASSVISATVSMYRHALDFLGLRIRGRHRGWTMEGIEPVPFSACRDWIPASRLRSTERVTASKRAA